MKSKYETLLSVVDYVKNESESPIDELMLMGFTPCQLVYEFGFDEAKVKASEVYEEIKDLTSEDLDYAEYPFVLDNYSPFDAAFVSCFELSKEALLTLKDTELYNDMKAVYEEQKIEALTEVLNEVFDRFEEKILDELTKEKPSLENQMLAAKEIQVKNSEKEIKHPDKNISL